MIGQVIGYRLLFIAIAAVILFLNLLPLGPIATFVPAPDLLTCFAIAWVIRRPDFVPLGLIAGVFFMADVLVMKPLGLWTLIVIVATEFLRRQVHQREALTFLSEMMQVTGVLLTAFVVERLVMLIILAETPPLLGQAAHFLITAIFYPAVVVVSQMLFGVRRLAAGEVDSLGSRV